VQHENSKRQIKSNLKTKRIKLNRAIRNRTNWASIALNTVSVPVRWRYRDVRQRSGSVIIKGKHHTGIAQARHLRASLSTHSCMSSVTSSDKQEKTRKLFLL